jgi:hypothetical protein
MLTLLETWILVPLVLAAVGAGGAPSSSAQRARA